MSGTAKNGRKRGNVENKRGRNNKGTTIEDKENMGKGVLLKRKPKICLPEAEI